MFPHIVVDTLHLLSIYAYLTCAYHNTIKNKIQYPIIIYLQHMNILFEYCLRLHIPSPYNYKLD